MRRIKVLRRRVPVRIGAGLAAAAAAAALTASAGLAAASTSAASFSFKLVPAPNIAACLPQAGGRVTITPGSLNDTMKVSIHGMPANTGFDLFVIQQPLAPFGVSWYQSDVNAGASGSGSATVRGIFDV